ncbi:hypothetical protein GCM10027035_12460 [Emticicia sediminis]
METIEFKLIEPDFITYYQDGKLFMYSDTMNDCKELKKEDLKNMVISGNEFNHKGFGIIDLIINEKKLPVFMPDYMVYLYNKIINVIYNFDKFFIDIVHNEINLRGKKIEALTSSIVNQQSFYYLYNQNPKYNISFGVEFKYVKKVNQFGIIGLKINYPKDVKKLPNAKEELLSDIQNFIFNLYRNDNIKFSQTINNANSKKELSITENIEAVPEHTYKLYEVYRHELKKFKNNHKKALDSISIKTFEDKFRENYKGSTLKNVKDKIRNDFQKHNLISKKQR